MIRVASYCRVSTDKDDQANSFASQQRYFREYIGNHPDWELYEVYADEGITGTSTKKRTQFNRMIRDARDGHFSLIITKEVSRFSRNILDTISYSRELKALGVGILFMNDGISTLEPDAELRLSIMGSIAQEESRKTSARVVWGQTRQMERGVVFGRSMLGYDVAGGKMTINPEGAELVRLIFHKYVTEQFGATAIARFLTEEGYRTHRGSTVWKPNTVVKILKNEKYAGDLVQKKTYTPDYLTHEKRRNTGQVPLIVIRNHHEPIVSHEVWNLAQQRLRINNKHKCSTGGHSSRHVFSGRIRCGECGAAFVCGYKFRSDRTKVRRWHCRTPGCGISRIVRDDDAMRMLSTAIRNLSMDRQSVINEVTALAMEPVLSEGGENMIHAERVTRESGRITKKKERLLDLFLDGGIGKSDMQAMIENYDRQLEKLQLQLSGLREETSSQDPLQCRASIREVIGAALAGEIQSEGFCRSILEGLTVFRDRHMELKLKGLPQVFHFTG